MVTDIAAEEKSWALSITLTSAPHGGEDHPAGATEMRKSFIVTHRILRHRYLERAGRDDSQEAATPRSRIELEGDDYDGVLKDHGSRLERAKLQIKTGRSKKWSEWAKDSWINDKKVIYRWTTGRSAKVDPGIECK